MIFLGANKHGWMDGLAFYFRVSERNDIFGLISEGSQATAIESTEHRIDVFDHHAVV